MWSGEYSASNFILDKYRRHETRGGHKTLVFCFMRSYACDKGIIDGEIYTFSA